MPIRHRLVRVSYAEETGFIEWLSVEADGQRGAERKFVELDRFRKVVPGLRPDTG